MLESTHASVRTIESLGKVIYETKPKSSNVVAGFILSVGLIVGGPLLTAYMVRQMFFAGVPPQGAGNWAGAVMIALLGLALCGGGVWLFFYVRMLFGFRLRVCAEGFWFTRGNHDQVFAWDEIVRVQENVVRERLPVVKGVAKHLVPKTTSRSFTVIRCDGEQFFFDDNVMPRTSLLSGPLASAAKKRDIPWDKTEHED